MSWYIKTDHKNDGRTTIYRKGAHHAIDAGQLNGYKLYLPPTGLPGIMQPRLDNLRRTQTSTLAIISM